MTLRLAVFCLSTALLLIACKVEEPASDDSANAPSQTEELPTATPEATRALERTPTPRSTATPTQEPSPTPIATPAAEAEVIGDDLLRLQEEMASAIDAYWVAGKYAVAVTDMQTGETVGVNHEEPRLSGCSMNLFVLYRAALDVQEGRYGLDRIDYLVRATTWSSNATTARDLYAVAGDGDAAEGVRRVAALIADLGLGDVLLDHPPGYPEPSLGLDFNNWVTAKAMNRGLAALWDGEVVDGEMRDYLLARLTEVKPGLNYLTAYVPEGSVSHKNGFFLGDTGFVDNDSGIVVLARGEERYAYALTFLSQEVPSKYGDIALGQQLGAMAYEVMAARYP